MNLLIVVQLRASENQEPLFFPWGRGEGELAANFDVEEAVTRFKGPSSFCIDSGGRICILDALEPCIEVYDKNGKHLSRYPLPVVDEEDQPLTYSDIASDNQGALYVLETNHGSIIETGPIQKKAKVLPVPGLASFHMLTTMARMKDGTFLVYEALSGNIIVISQNGRLLNCFKEPSLKALILDDRGFVLGIRRPRPRLILLLAFEAKSARGKILKKFRLKRNDSALFVRGYDGQGTVYLERSRQSKKARGGEEHQLILWSKAKGVTVGPKLGRCGFEKSMTRTLRVQKEGTIARSKYLSEGFELRLYEPQRSMQR